MDNMLDIFNRASENDDDIPGFIEYKILMDQMKDPCMNNNDCLAVFHSRSIEFDKESTKQIYLQVLEAIKKFFDITVDINNDDNRNFYDSIYLVYKLCVVNLISTITNYIYEIIKGNFNSNNISKLLKAYNAPDYKDSGMSHTYDEYNLIKNISKVCADICNRGDSLYDILDIVEDSDGDTTFISHLKRLSDDNVIAAENLMSDMFEYLNDNNIMESINLKVLFLLWDNGLIKMQPLDTMRDKEEDEDE